MRDEIYLLYHSGCRHLQIDEPMLSSIADSTSMSQALAMVKKITVCFEVHYIIAFWWSWPIRHHVLNSTDLCSVV